MRAMNITFGSLIIEVRLFDTVTADKLYTAAPFVSVAQTWGNEVYFSTRVNLLRESNARSIVQYGEVAFWLEGSAIAIGYGPTPISIGDEIRLASDCNIWGEIKGDLLGLGAVSAGGQVRVKQCNSNG